MTVKRGRVLASAIFLAIAILVAGGLAWVTRQALRLEHADTIRLALWRMDGRIFPILAREDSRPVVHYEPLYPPVPALDRKGNQVPLGNVLVPSPLLNAELPDWLVIHFVVDAKYGWRSPQVPDEALAERLKATPTGISIINATPARQQRLQELAEAFPTSDWFGSPQQEVAAQQIEKQSNDYVGRGSRSAQPQQAGQWLELESQVRKDTQTALRNEGKNLDSNAGPTIVNRLPPGLLFKEGPGGISYACSSANVEDMSAQWRRGRDGVNRLMYLRKVQSDGMTFIQGVAFDWQKLRGVLLDQVKDLLPDASLEPAIEEEDRGYSMQALPVALTGGDVPMHMFPLKTPLRWGLALAWAAALLAIGVVALTGWSLLDLSERRFRFVTAVTHELRTPLTTLRLYLDMLTSGMVREEKQRDEYLNTLHGEADRLHRLIGNVLDYARLERQQPVVTRQPMALTDLIETLRGDWEGHCKSAGKALTLELAENLPREITTDADLCRQLLGNLLDNACKYSGGASDPRIWLRVNCFDENVCFEIEDKGPGVPSRESRSVFRAFRRGQTAPTTAGGVGLGLALADRWSKLLGGTLTLKPGNGGACFQFTQPIGHNA